MMNKQKREEQHGIHYLFCSKIRDSITPKNIKANNMIVMKKLMVPVVRKNSFSTQNQTVPIKCKVISLYKNLIYLSRDWPTDLRPQIKRAFLKNKDVKNEQEIRQLIARGEYVCREITAAYQLKKYRTLKKRYYNTEENPYLQSIFKSFQ